jgi:hypothetical protein
MNIQQNSTTNYLVPAAGQTHAVSFEGVFSGAAQKIDWRQYAVDNFPFNPQGVFIDNSAGVAELIILIKPINYTVSCPAGQRIQAQFPAPNGQTMEITGNGQASIFFVDFPVLPNNGQVNISGTIQANIESVSPGVSFDTYIKPTPVTAFYAQITGAATSASINPPDNTNLKKLILSINASARLAASGDVPITVTLNGSQIFKMTIYLGAGNSGGDSFAEDYQLDFSNLGLNSGAGDLVTSIGTALAGGAVDINAYFG